MVHRWKTARRTTQAPSPIPRARVLGHTGRWEDQLRPGDTWISMTDAFGRVMHYVRLERALDSMNHRWEGQPLCGPAAAGDVSSSVTWLPMPKAPFGFVKCPRCVKLHPQKPRNQGVRRKLA